MTIIVLVTDYPHPSGRISMNYVHVRNKYYIMAGIDVTVVSFSATDDYVIDGVPVVTLASYSSRLSSKQMDVLVCHAPNLRNHYLFLHRYQRLFSKIIFVFHGHEVLRCAKAYPSPYDYVRSENRIYFWVKDLYDILKLSVWRAYFPTITPKAAFFFVSKTMYQCFVEHVRINPALIEPQTYIIHNPIGVSFQDSIYDPTCTKEHDFITIRSDLDSSTYAIDVVTELALANPQFTFLVVGKGSYYDHNPRPDNVTLVQKYLNHEEIIAIINKARCALMPTRHDTQGVMACEMATFGIPLITSDLPVCREIFAGYMNVEFLNNTTPSIDINPIFRRLIDSCPSRKPERYFSKNTCAREVAVFRQLTHDWGIQE